MIKKAGAALACLLTLFLIQGDAASSGAEERYSLLGEWAVIQKQGSEPMTFREDGPYDGEEKICLEAVTHRLGSDLFMLDCLTRKGWQQMNFLFQSADRALYWSSRTGDRRDHFRDDFLLRRRSPSPLPEGLLGEWIEEETGEGYAGPTYRVRFGPGPARTDRAPEGENCGSSLLSGAPQGVYELLLECTLGTERGGKIYRLQALPSGEFLRLGPSGESKALLRRPDSSPLPESLHGDWVEEKLALGRTGRTHRVHFGPDSARTDRIPKARDCAAALLPVVTEGVREVLLECSVGKGRQGIILRLQEQASGGFLVLGIGDEPHSLFYREGERPLWAALRSEEKGFSGCDSVTDSAARDACFDRRSLCGKISDLSARDACYDRNSLCAEISSAGARDSCFDREALCGKVTDADLRSKCAERVGAEEKSAALEEARANLGAIRSTEIAYFAEWNMWVGNQPLTPVPDRRGDDRKVAWDRETRFRLLGFQPEGGVSCSYALDGPDFPAPDEGFQARAECDLDGDGEPSIWSITSKDAEVRHSGDDR